MKESVLIMKLRMLRGLFIGVVAMTLLPAFGQSSLVSGVALEGQNSGDANTWSGGNLSGWQELQFIPCRVLFTGSGNNQSITLTFPHLSGTTPGFENLYNFTTSSNVSFVSAPVLSAPASGSWSYTFKVNVTNGGSVNFFARLAAGAHLNVGSSLKMGGSPSSMGELQVHKPQPGAGAPDLAVVKTGPATVPQGGTVVYTLTYTNKATGTNVGVGVQLSDILPPGVTINPSTLPAGANYAGNTIFFDVPDLPPHAGGQITFQAGVPLSIPSGTVLTNFAQILCSQDDANSQDNTSKWQTKVTAGCTNLVVSTPPADQTACPGNTAIFSVTASGTALTYQWYKGANLLGGETNNTLSVANVSALSAGKYSVVISDLCCDAVTNSATLTVNSSTVISMPPSNQTVCPGQTAQFSVSATGTDLTYQWYYGNSQITGETNNVLTLAGVRAMNAGTYSVVITSACGNAVTNGATLVVNSPALVIVPPMNSTNCPGTTANFSVTASGTGLTYEWFKGPALFLGTNSSIAITNVTAANAGVYTVVVTGACGTSVTNSATLAVNAITSVTNGPSDVTSCPGGMVNFSVNAAGTDLTYQWYAGANVLTNETNSTLSVTNVSADSAGIYSVVVSGECGSPITNSAVLTVNTSLSVSTPPADQTVCPGETAIFSESAAGTGLAYQWYYGSNPLPAQTNGTLTLTNVSAASAGTYSVVVTGACGMSATNSALLVVNAGTLVTVPPINSTNCPGTTANFSVTATGTGLAYAWFKGPAVFLGTNSSISISGVTDESAGVYTVIVTGACGNSITNTATLVVNVPTLITVPPANTTNCPYTTAFFSVNATGTGLSYQWYHGANSLPHQTGSVLAVTNVYAGSAGIYSVVVSGECGNSVTNSAVLVVNQNVSVAPLANVTNIIGSSAVFTAVASGTGPFAYQWYQGANALSSQTNSTLTLSNLQPGNGGAYSVSVTGQCGNAAVAGFVLTIDLPPVVSITYPTNGQVFIDPATFNVMAAASDPDGTVTNVQFFSSTNGTDFVFLGQTNNTPYLTIASNLPAGSYTLIAVATDNLGATAQSEPVTVQVVPTEAPTVSIIGNMTLNLQDGYQWLSNVVCNPVNSHAEAVRVYIHNITNSTIQVVNASGTNGGLPYIQSPAAIQPGSCWTNVIMFFDPYGVKFSPTLTTELVPVPNAAGNPAGVPVAMLPAQMLRDGTFLVEFASTNGATYYVQYSSDLLNWNTAFPAITGTGQHAQWIDSGPPATASLPAANVKRFYRVIKAQ